MAQINVTASDLNVAKQRIQEKYTKIELLNSRMQVVDSLEGVALNGSINVDANSDMRRSATIKFVITDSSFEVESGGKIFLDKYIRIYLGTYSLSENQIIYKKIGTFLIDAPTYEYDAVNNSIQLSLLDLMSKLSGIRSGYLRGVPVTIKAGENIRTAIIDTLRLGGFTKYVCDEAPNGGLLPNDLNFPQGSTIYTILSGLRDVYPNYEIYFDVDGVFHYNKIPTGENEPIQIDDTLWESIVISENVNVDFQNVKNYVEVYGRTHDPSYFSSNTTHSGNALTLTISGLTGYTDGVIYGFTLTDDPGRAYTSVAINNGETTFARYNLRTDEGHYGIATPDSGEVYYCIQFMENNGSPYFRWLGHLQAYGLAFDIFPNSPFFIFGSVGYIRLPLYGGEYENCFTDELAEERAKYELYMHTNMQNSLTITCAPIPWLDVNTLVEYTLQRNGEKSQYLIKSFSYGFNITDTMTINMIKFYPEWPGM